MTEAVLAMPAGASHTLEMDHSQGTEAAIHMGSQCTLRSDECQMPNRVEVRRYGGQYDCPPRGLCQKTQRMQPFTRWYR